MSPYIERSAALYLRVSTSEQCTDNQSYELRRMASLRGLTVVDEFEEHVSALASDKPEFERMMKDARTGKFQVLLIWALDRLGRSMLGNLQTVLELDRIGVRVVSVQESWLDTAGPTRDLLLAIFSWVAQQERHRLIERTRAGMEKARRAGKRIGRPRNFFDVNKAVILRSQGMSLRQICQRLHVPRSTLARALQKKMSLQPAAPTHRAAASSTEKERAA
jgi:DNA invertase Pin-like site-specific DNA recombinase